MIESRLNTDQAEYEISRPSALKLVILIGLVSLFADVTYEGARSISGPFLAVLGASATSVGIIAGCGELIGYALRLASGYLADRSKKYWTLLFAGYGLTFIAVPLLALAGSWEIAALLLVAERIGKAIRTPSRDVILSCASDQIGRGWGFGLHEALDQVGAICGPLAMAAAFYFTGSYRTGFCLLLIPALVAFSVLAFARQVYPNPHDLESATIKLESKGFSRSFWLYLVAIGCVAAGYADFPLVAYHFKKVGTVPEYCIPIFYAVAMGVDAVAALIFGRLFDRIGFPVLLAPVLLSSLFAPLAFWGGFYPALVGMALWGVGMGAQESIVRAAIADMVPRARLGFAFGLFNTAYGFAWFFGSALMGLLYDVSVTALVVFSIAAQLAAVPVLLISRGQIGE
jgi:MFS family permease